MNTSGVKIIPADLKPNNVSPTEEQIARINDQGNVDFFIKCGKWYTGEGENKKFIYYKFSFQVDDQNIYNSNYTSVNDFVTAIQNRQIKGLTASIIEPNVDLTGVHFTHMDGKEIPNINIKIQGILDDMKDIGTSSNSWAIDMVKFLYKYGLKEEAVKLCEADPKKEIIKFLADIIKQELKQNQELKQQSEGEYVKKGNAEIKDLDRTLKGTLYKKKDKGFFSIFGCCTCGLDNIAEMENEINLISE